MKKYILILILMLTIGVIQAQDVTKDFAIELNKENQYDWGELNRNSTLTYTFSVTQRFYLEMLFECYPSQGVRAKFDKNSIRLINTDNNTIVSAHQKHWEADDVFDTYYLLEAGNYKYTMNLVTDGGVYYQIQLNNYPGVIPSSPYQQESFQIWGNSIATITPNSPLKSVSFLKGGKLHLEKKESDIEIKDVSAVIQYFDGLGRPMQTVQRGITPDAKDLVSIQEYDGFGRESNAWLPGKVTTNNNGSFVKFDDAKEYIKASNRGASSTKEDNPYSKPVYEASPLNRVLKQFGPGMDWHNDNDVNNQRSVNSSYLTNIIGDARLNCIIYTATDLGDTIVAVNKGTNYNTGELFVNKITDENRNESYEFKDKLGQVILTRQINQNQNYDTYYVYDDFGNQKAVLPPLLADEFAKQGLNTKWDNKKDSLMRQYAYLYKYDARNRCVNKRIPGTSWINYVYDQADRLIFSQDGEQRTKDEWMFSIPDQFGRAVLSGICKNSLSHNANPLKDKVVRAEWAKATNDYKGYNVTGVTLTNPTIQTVNYYDNYDFMGENGIPAIADNHMKPETLNEYGIPDITKVKGMQTGGMVALLDGTNNMLYSVIYYDKRARLVQTKSINHLGGVEKEYLALNFTGQPTQKMHVHSATGQTTQTELYTYIYDHAGRLLETKHKLNSMPEILLAQNEYDDLGRLKSNQKMNNPNLKLNYAYNVRSWLRLITGNYYYHALNYNERHIHVNQRNYNGNITTITSRSIQDEQYPHTYWFSYDNLSRLTSAKHVMTKGSIQVAGNYDSGYWYDKHGNVTKLGNRGKVNDGSYNYIDQLTFTYSGNQMKSVDDRISNVSIPESADFKDNAKKAIEYAYNANGAMTMDLNKGIQEIEYNSLNLPRRMTIKSPVTEGEIEYTYTASGAKLRVIHRDADNLSSLSIPGYAAPTSGGRVQTTDYAGNKIYENNSLKKILVDGGYIENGEYYFYMKDHLGNNRVVVKQDGSVIQKTHYYPFGMAFAESTHSGAQSFKYNGKELDVKYGLNQYDYSARHYDPARIRFTSVDPLAEKYYSISPYVYCANNPIKNIDINGDSITVLNMDEGQHVALLIQNNKGKWQYYSVNGDNVYVSGKHTGGRKFNDLGVGEFDNPQQFMESAYNSKGSSDDKSINYYEFGEGYTIPTTQEQDNVVRDTFTSISDNEEYSLSLGNPNQCATIVQRSLNKAGIETRINRTIMNRSTGGDSYQTKYNPYLPSQAFKAIMNNNPQGQYIKKQK